MNKRFPIYALLAFVLSAFAVSCNSDEDEDLGIVDMSRNALMVNTFALQKNDSVLVNLDSVYFSIDLDRGVIFNADSLPRGTRVNALIIDMSMSAVTKAEITMPSRDGRTDTVVNFLKNATDSINFSRGYVKLHLESANKEYQRDYTIYVNVHKIDPDLLAWTEIASSQLPTTFADAEQQHTVEYQGKTLCFTRRGTDCNIASSADPATEPWTNEVAILPSDADLNTLTAGATALYICDVNGDLHSSADGGKTWSATGQKMNHIYGTIEDRVIGAVNTSAGWTHVTYPASFTAAVASDCPVSATSPAVVFTSEWSDQPMMLVAGGQTASGQLTDATWAFDGNQWVKLSIDGFGKALKSPVIVPYFAFKISSNWLVTKRSILMAFNGLDEVGAVNRKIYVSYDRGVHWAPGSGWMEIPAAFVGGAYSQAVVVNRTFTTESTAAARWTSEQPVRLAPWLCAASAPESRASKPISEWDCPYIYVYGGESASGVLYKSVWRGVINRLEFKPLQ